MTHYYHPDYLRISTGFDLDDTATAEMVRDEYLPAMEEQARRCERVAYKLLRDGWVGEETLNPKHWREQAKEIRGHIAVARQRLRRAGYGEEVT